MSRSAALAERIVDSADRFVRSRSFLELTIGELMQDVGEDRPVFYHVYASIGEVGLALIDRVSNQYWAKMGEWILNADIPLVPRIYPNQLNTARLFLQCGYLSQAISEAEQKCPPVRLRMLEVREKWEGAIRRLIAAAIDRGEVPRSVDPWQAAIGIHSALDGFLSYAMGRSPMMEAEQAATIMTRYYYGQLGLCDGCLQSA